MFRYIGRIALSVIGDGSMYEHYLISFVFNHISIIFLLGIFFLALVFLRFTLLEFSDWTKVEEDSRKAIELDYNSVKVCIYGFFLLILILHSCILVFELDHSWKTTGYYSVIRRFNSSMLGNYKFARLQFNWLLYDFNYLNRSELHTARATIAFHKSIHPFNILFFLCHSFRWLIIILYFPI